MDYDEALRWLATLPDFERSGDFAERPDVAPVLGLLAALGDPHRGRATLHIAGSKGKGSTAAMAEAVLRAAGRRTGCYISPHLHRFTERIRVGGEAAAPEVFAQAMTAVREAIERVQADFPGRSFLAFDALTAAAFVAFRDAGCDAQVIEVGLGGLLDSTNVFQDGTDATSVVGDGADATSVVEDGADATGVVEDGADRSKDLSLRGGGASHVSAITSISLEHTAVLGSTIPAIAAQKAGIIVRGDAVIAAPMRESALDVVRERAAAQGATVIEVARVCQLTRTQAGLEGQDFKLKTQRATYAAHLPLIGRHQLDNAATAVLACEALAERAGFELTPDAVRRGLADVVWPARLEVLKRRPLFIIDGAHNADSAKRMAEALRSDLGLTRAVVLVGTLSDKDVEGIAAAVAPLASEVLAPAWPSARAMDPARVSAAFRPYDVPTTAYPSLGDACDAALAAAGEHGAVLACGAISFAAAVREYLLGIQSDTIRLQTSATGQGAPPRGEHAER